MTAPRDTGRGYATRHGHGMYTDNILGHPEGGYGHVMAPHGKRYCEHCARYQPRWGYAAKGWRCQACSTPSAAT